MNDRTSSQGDADAGGAAARPAGDSAAAAEKPRAPGSTAGPNDAPEPAMSDTPAADVLAATDASRAAERQAAGPDQDADDILKRVRERLEGARSLVHELFEVVTGQKQIDDTKIVENAHLIPRAMAFVPADSRDEVAKIMQHAATGQLGAIAAGGGVSAAAKEGLAEAVLMTGG